MEEVWHVRKIDGRVVGFPFSHGLAGSRCDKKGFETDLVTESFICIGSTYQGKQMENFQISQLDHYLLQRSDQVLWFAAARADKNSVTTSD